jgi:hypothetical protein
VKGHKHFLKYVPAAMTFLRSVVEQIEGLHELEAQLGEMISR